MFIYDISSKPPHSIVKILNSNSLNPKEMIKILYLYMVKTFC